MPANSLKSYARAFSKIYHHMPVHSHPLVGTQAHTHLLFLAPSAPSTLAATALTIHLLEHAEAYANLVHVWPDVKLALRVGVGQVLVHHRPQMILRLL